jgi:type II secretory pathway pseudopilin PulG
MYLRGQARRPTGSRTRRNPAGYAMAALLVAIAVLTIMLSVAMPVWRHEMQREREAELVFRGEQYIRAIDLFQRKYAGALPPTIDVLVTERFLRKKYKDPMTEDGEFRVIAAGAQQQPGLPQPGGPDARPGQQPQLRATVQPPTSAFGQSRPGAQPPVGAGIIGVASKSKEKSIRLYKGRNKYDEWQFIFASIGARPGAPGQQPNRPGQQNLPGMRPGFPRPGQPGMPGQPGPGDPLRRRPGMNPPVVKPGTSGTGQRPPG